MSFSLPATLTQESPLNLIREMTGIDDWQPGPQIMPYQTQFILVDRQIDARLLSVLAGLHAAATEIQPTSGFTTITDLGVKNTLSRGFNLARQWEGGSLENRAYLRFVISGNLHAIEPRISTTVMCDEWGNALRRNREVIERGIASFLARHAERSGTPPMLNHIFGGQAP